MRTNFRKNVALLLTAIICIGLVAACAPQTPEAPETPETTSPAPAELAPAPDEITVEAAAPAEGANLAEHINVVGMLSDINVLNPTIPGASMESAWIMGMLTDRLIEIYGPNDFRPGLALSWETDDHKTIRFNLRPDVLWHNGERFTADDVAFTMEIAHANPGGTSWTVFRDVTEVNVVDDLTIELTFAAINIDFEMTFAGWASGILSRVEYAARPDDPLWATVGTGPFKLAGFQAANFTTVERFDGFWGELAPTQRVTFWSIPEMATRMTMLQAGELQVVTMLNTEDLDNLIDNPNFNLIRDPVHMPYYLSFNNQGDDIMMDLNFRLAVAHALNLDDVAIVANGNWASAWPSGSLWGQRTPYFRTDLPVREFNLDLARQYLEASVWNGEQIDMVATPGIFARGAEMVQMQLSNLGIDVNIDIMDVPSYAAAFAFGREHQQGRQMHLFQMGFGPTVLAGRSILYPDNVTNRINLNSDFVTERFDILATETNPGVQRQLALEMQQYLYDNLVAIPLFQIVQGIATAPGVGGMHLWGDSFRYNMRGIYWDLNQTPEHLMP